MLRSPVVFAGLSLAVMCGTYVVGCGSDDAEEAAPPAAGVTPPAEPSGAPSASGPGTVFAVNRLYLGDTDRSGAANPNAWKDYGYDLDGKVSTADSTDLCTPYGNASPKTVYPDGNLGRDNSFGKNLLPIITGLASDASSAINETINEGSFTIIMNLDNLGDEASQTGVNGTLLVGADLGMAPSFDGSDTWPYFSGFQVDFPGSYVNEQTWVSGGTGNLDLSVSIAGFSLTLNIANAVITMDLDGGRTGATNGTIAGVIPVESFLDELSKVAGAFDESLCSGATLESIKEQIRGASDMLADGTSTPGQTCDGISIGLGFDAGTIQLGEAVAPPSEVEDPCNPSEGGGGAGGGGTGGGAQGGAGGAGGA